MSPTIPDCIAFERSSLSIRPVAALRAASGLLRPPTILPADMPDVANPLAIVPSTLSLCANIPPVTLPVVTCVCVQFDVALNIACAKFALCKPETGISIAAVPVAVATHIPPVPDCDTMTYPAHAPVDTSIHNLTATYLPIASAVGIAITPQNGMYICSVV